MATINRTFMQSVIRAILKLRVAISDSLRSRIANEWQQRLTDYQVYAILMENYDADAGAARAVLRLDGGMSNSLLNKIEGIILSEERSQNFYKEFSQSDTRNIRGALKRVYFRRLIDSQKTRLKILSAWLSGKGDEELKRELQQVLSKYPRDAKEQLGMSVSQITNILESLKA